jgi:hypothetical protein
MWHMKRGPDLAIANRPAMNGMKYDRSERRRGELITPLHEERTVTPESRAGVPAAFMVKLKQQSLN